MPEDGLCGRNMQHILAKLTKLVYGSTYVNTDMTYHNTVIFFCSLSYDRSKASSKASPPNSAIQSFLFQILSFP